MFISHLLATSWIVFSVGKSVHDDFETRRRLQSHKSEVGTNVWVGDDEKFCSGFNCGPNCWRPFFCKLDTKTCNGETLRRCGAQCRFPRCPDPVCPTDVKECPDGTILKRDPATCKFPTCPRPPSCSPSLGFRTCPDGSRVGRDPNNLCITWLPCPTALGTTLLDDTCEYIEGLKFADGAVTSQRDFLVKRCNEFQGSATTPSSDESIALLDDTCEYIEGLMFVDGSSPMARDRDHLVQSCNEFQGSATTLTFTCANGWQKIPMDQVCNGRRVCYDGSDEWRSHGCQQFTIGGRRRSEETLELESEDVDQLDSPAQRRLRAPPTTYSCFSGGSPSRWTLGKQRWCCNNFNRGCQYLSTPEPYNCYTRESWSSQKRRWCCSNKGLGCSVYTPGGQPEYTPGGEYNCNYGRPSSWTRLKSSFCCRTQGRGCSGGRPTIGG